MTKAPLRRVINRTGVPAFDRLECGHVVPFDGFMAERRRCAQCATHEGQLELDAEPS